jgi:hypothetical protein
MDESREVGVGASVRGQPRDQRLDPQPGFEHIAQRPLGVVEDVGEPDHGLIRRGTGQEDPRPVARFHQPYRLEGGDRLPQGVARDSESIREHPLRRQRAPRLELPGADQVLQVVPDLLVDRGPFNPERLCHPIR